MSKTIKSVLVFIAFAIIALSSTFCLILMDRVKAESSVPVKMVEGASVRYKREETTDRSGIRFSAQVEKTYKEANPDAVYGMLLIPSELLGGEELTALTPNVSDTEIHVWADSEIYGYDLFNVVLYNIPAEKYGETITARAYVKNNGVYTYSEAIVVRSVGQVASIALAEGDTHTSELENYIDGAVDTFEVEDIFELEIGTTKAAPVTISPQELVAIYTVEGDAVTVNENGEITALSVGEASVKVRLGSEEKTILVKVNELLDLQFEDSTARTIYTNTIEDHAMTTTLTPVIKANGQVVADPSVSWKVSDESGAASDLVTVDSQGIVSANENGKSGTAYVSYIYNAVESAKVAIHVEYPVVDRTDIKVDVEFDAEGKVAVTAIEEKLTTPVVDVVGYEFAEGKVQNAVAGETTWKVLNGEQYVCEVSVVVCTKIIRTADDLDSMMDLATKEKVGDLQYNVLAKPHYSYDGYFILGANIDYQNKVYDSGTMQLMLNQCASNAITANVGFKGTFDGRGYTIKNIEFFASGAGDLLSSNPDDPRAIDWEAETGVAGQQYRGNEFTCGGGLFGAIAQTGVVKNLCLANVTLADCTGSAPLATNLSGTVDNVNIQIVKTGMSTNIRVAGIAVGTMGAKIQNTFIYLAPGAIGHRTYYGWISCLDYKTVDSRISSISEVYVIRTYGGDRYWASENEPYANPYDPAKATAGNSGGAPFKDLKVYQKDGEKLSPAKPNLEDYLTDLENGTITFNGYDKNIWNFDTADKYPTFKTNC